jgi:hypothetical protein
MAISRFRMTTMNIDPNSMPDFHVVNSITFSKCKINIDVQHLLKICLFYKGRLILKCLFGVFNFFQKMNENKST